LGYSGGETIVPICELTVHLTSLDKKKKLRIIKEKNGGEGLKMIVKRRRGSGKRRTIFELANLLVQSIAKDPRQTEE